MKALMVVGLIISNEQVLLIKKMAAPRTYNGVGRPKSMNGRYNGVGGVVMDNETAIECLVRKTQAECGLFTVPAQWIPFHEIQLGRSRILFAKCAMSPREIAKAKSPTDEEVSLISVNKLASYPTVANIPWLVAMALDNSHSFSISEIEGMGAIELNTEVMLGSTSWATTGVTPSPTAIAGDSKTKGSAIDDVNFTAGGSFLENEAKTTTDPSSTASTSETKVAALKENLAASTAAMNKSTEVVSEPNTEAISTTAALDEGDLIDKE
jgi:ADP-ribose pyrophosphatase YjhB (NUDIX family)